MNPKNKLTYELLNIINYGGAIDNLKELIGEDDIFVNYFNVFRMLKKNHISNNFQSFIKKVYINKKDTQREVYCFDKIFR